MPKIEIQDNSAGNEDEFYGGHFKVAHALRKYIRTQGGGVSISLEGRWGSGKSTIINLLGKLLNQNEYMYIFDAWAHSGEELRRNFLEELMENLKNRNWISKYYQEKKELYLSGKRKIDKTYTTQEFTLLGLVVSAIILFLFPLGLVLLSEGVDQACIFCQSPIKWQSLTSLIIFSLPILITIILFIFHKETKFNLKNLFKEKSWSKILCLFTNTQSDKLTISDSITSNNPTSIEFESAFYEILQKIKPKDWKLIIVLDNLDRIPESFALEILSTLQIFMQYQINNRNEDRQNLFKRIYTIVPYDPIGLNRLWNDKENCDPNNFSEIAKSMLEKKFQVKFYTPPLVLSSWKDFCILKLESAILYNEYHNSFEDVYHIFRILFNSKRDGGSKFTYGDDQGNGEMIYQYYCPSPREIINLINQLSVCLLQNDSDQNSKLSITSMALFSFEKIYFPTADLITELISGKLKKSYPDELFLFLDENWENELLAIIFNVDIERAKEIVYIPTLLNLLRNGETTELIHLHKRINGISALIESILLGNINDIYNIYELLILIPTINEIIDNIEFNDLKARNIVKSITRKIVKSKPPKSFSNGDVKNINIIYSNLIKHNISTIDYVNFIVGCLQFISKSFNNDDSSSKENKLDDGLINWIDSYISISENIPEIREKNYFINCNPTTLIKGYTHLSCKEKKHWGILVENSINWEQQEKIILDKINSYIFRGVIDFPESITSADIKNFIDINNYLKKHSTKKILQAVKGEFNSCGIVVSELSIATFILWNEFLEKNSIFVSSEIHFILHYFNEVYTSEKVDEKENLSGLLIFLIIYLNPSLDYGSVIGNSEAGRKIFVEEIVNNVFNNNENLFENFMFYLSEFFEKFPTLINDFVEKLILSYGNKEGLGFINKILNQAFLINDGIKSETLLNNLSCLSAIGYTTEVEEFVKLYSDNTDLISIITGSDFEEKEEYEFLYSILIDNDEKIILDWVWTKLLLFSEEKFSVAFEEQSNLIWLLISIADSSPRRKLTEQFCIAFEKEIKTFISKPKDLDEFGDWWNKLKTLYRKKDEFKSFLIRQALLYASELSETFLIYYGDDIFEHKTLVKFKDRIIDDFFVPLIDSYNQKGIEGISHYLDSNDVHFRSFGKKEVWSELLVRVEIVLKSHSEDENLKNIFEKIKNHLDSTG